jgi:cytoskeleton protein RodZ
VTVGETLSNARRERGLSVDDVAAATRVRATLVRNIEADDFRLCGGNVYARGHIRSIARVVGIDAEPLIGEFDGAHQVEGATSTVAAQPTDHDLVSRVSRAPRSERRLPNRTLAIAAAVIVVAALAVTPFLFGHSGNKHPQAAPPASTAPKPTTKPTTPVSPPPSTVARLPVSHATLVVRTLHGKTWLSIKNKTGKTLFLGVLAAGERKEFTSRHGLAYIIGDAPVVDVVVNGHDIGSPPSSGNVSRGRVVPGADTVQQA